MICDRVREQIPECLAGRLDATARARVIDHLETCSACRGEMAAMGAVWRGLEAMEQPEPSVTVRTRFLETLHAYEEGYQEAQRRQTYVATPASFWAGWWPARPAWQMLFSAALLIAGAAGGRFALAPSGSGVANPELAHLQGQVENLRQLVALSLLQQQSPSSRLRGVTYSYQMTRPDRQVEQALLQAANHDSNVNVRLSAVDALAKFMGNPEVRRALADSLPVQDSPLVQVAMIDVLVQANGKSTVAALEKISKDTTVDEAVRQRAAEALKKLGGAQ